MPRRHTTEKTAEQPFVIKRSPIAGKGAFATRAIKKGERIAEYVGERITHAEADARYDDYANGSHHTFLFAVNRRTVIDATVGGNDSRFINHSCTPNCESVIEGSRVFVEAIRDIRAGEELTYDYAYTRDGTETPEDEAGLYGCRCGTRQCRGTILAPVERKAKKKKSTTTAKAKRRRAA